MNGIDAFHQARDLLRLHRDDRARAVREFRWPQLGEFNWALDHFDALARDPERGGAAALWIVGEDSSELKRTLAPCVHASRERAEAIFAFARRQLAPYKRVRRIEFVTELPKTISGKIRRVQLRAQEVERRAAGMRIEGEFFDEDFPNLKSDG